MSTVWGRRGWREGWGRGGVSAVSHARSQSRPADGAMMMGFIVSVETSRGLVHELQPLMWPSRDGTLLFLSSHMFVSLLGGKKVLIDTFMFPNKFISPHRKQHTELMRFSVLFSACVIVGDSFQARVFLVCQPVGRKYSLCPWLCDWEGWVCVSPEGSAFLIPWQPSPCLSGTVLTNALLKCVGICWGFYFCCCCCCSQNPNSENDAGLLN